MQETDRELAKRVCDVVAVATDDIDTITVAVEDGVAYIEGVVETEQKRQSIISAVQAVAGLDRVITCLATEHVLPRIKSSHRRQSSPLSGAMQKYSLS